MKNIQITNETGKAVITLTGFISDSSNSSGEIVRVLDECFANPNITEIEVVCMNFYGGDVFHGFPIRNKIKASIKPIKTKAEGIVASMGSVIYTAGHVKEIAIGSRLVLHKPSGRAEGQSHVLRSVADLMDGTEKDLIKCYSEDTGISEEDIISKFLQNDVDCYIDAESAVKYGFATGQYKGFIHNSVPADILKNSDIKAVATYYAQQFTNSLNQNNSMKDLVIYAALLGIPAETVTEEIVRAKVTAMKNELDEARTKITALETKQKADHEAAVKSLVSAAIDAGKIKEEQRKIYEGLATANLEATTEALNAMTAREPLSAKINNQLSGDATADETQKTWSYKDYLDKDPSGKILASMQKNNPERFNKLKAAYDKPVV